MPIRIEDHTVLRAPATVIERAGEAYVAIDPASPTWITTDERGLRIADIVAEGDVPAAMRADGQLWGECLSGALSEEAFLAAFEGAGFYGVSLLKKTFWREVEATRFHSVTVRGHKFEKQAGCRYVGQVAVYLGPMKAVVDEEGHMFPRGTPIEVCTDTAAKLSAAPYAGSFAVLDGPESGAAITAVDYGGADGTCC